MYIIELFFKLKEKFNKKTVKPVLDEPLQEQSESDETCEHIFSPIDSTNTVLATQMTLKRRIFLKKIR